MARPEPPFSTRTTDDPPTSCETALTRHCLATAKFKIIFCTHFSCRLSLHRSRFVRTAAGPIFDSLLPLIPAATQQPVDLSFRATRQLAPKTRVRAATIPRYIPAANPPGH